jgi:hypothetical protein
LELEDQEEERETGEVEAEKEEVRKFENSGFGA